jgi:hypothetical protein
LAKRATKQVAAPAERDKVAEWLADIRATADGAALEQLFAREPA